MVRMSSEVVNSFLNWVQVLHGGFYQREGSFRVHDPNKPNLQASGASLLVKNCLVFVLSDDSLASSVNMVLGIPLYGFHTAFSKYPQDHHNIHTNIHTHAHTHACAHICTMHTHMYTCTHVDMHTHICGGRGEGEKEKERVLSESHKHLFN